MADDDDDDDERWRDVERELDELARRHGYTADELVQRFVSVGAKAQAGDEFAQKLVQWIADGPPRRERGHRYLLMWYAKTIAQKSRTTVRDKEHVAKLLRVHLSDADCAAIDEVLRHNKWTATANGNALVSFAERLRRQFTASLTPDERQRLQPYLAALVPPVSMATLAPAPAPVPTGGPPVADPASSGLASHAVSVAIGLGLPIVVAAAWFTVRGGAPSTPDVEPPHAPRDRGSAVSSPAAAGASSTSAPDAGVDARASAGPSVVGDDAPVFEWTPRESGVSAMLTGIAWSDSRLVVVGDGGTILWSDDRGETWRASPQISSYSLLSVAWGGGRFVAVGGSRIASRTGRVILTSPDGEHWTPQRWTDYAVLHDVTYSDGVFVAVGTLGAIVRSTDGVTWRTVPSGTGEQIDAVNFLDGEFVGSSGLGPTVTSKDGLSWTLRPGPHDRGRYCCIVRDGAWYLQYGYLNDDAAIVRRSPDLMTWEERELPGLGYISDATRVDGRTLIVDDGLLSSADGLAWIREVPRGGPGQKLRRVSWTGAMLIAVGEHGRILTARAP